MNIDGTSPFLSVCDLLTYFPRSVQLAKVPVETRGFDNIIKCNIGNPQALQQKPLSFIRDVLSIMVNPSLVCQLLSLSLSLSLSCASLCL